MSQLELRDIRKTYPGAAEETLKGIDIDISSGEFLILVGPSGCGKSTLMNTIAGLESISGGEIVLDGQDVSGVEPKDRDIAMVFQSYALYPTMSVRENIAFGLKIRGMAKDQIEQEVERVADLLQISHLLDKKPSRLSGGQQQRVAMGRALARRPRIYLFDEPLSNLDAKLRVEMRTEIKKLHQRLKTTIVYVTHDQIEAMTLADRIAVLKDGELQQLGTPKDVYDSPQNMFVAGFMGSPAMSFVPVTVEQGNGALYAEVRGGDGRTVNLPVPDYLADRVGRSVVLGIRPEHITQPQDQKVDQALVTTGEFIIEVTEPTGPDVIALIRLNDTNVHCRIDPEHPVTWGENAELMFDMKKVVFFDPETEKRITG
ncbi:ABC transporter ATP-binding protein [Marinobacter arenosus]|uniref:ABC transporter ATP-binding protein n=1 Tax=Marinobacter arenosus TaxID=2856822 RepID=UPI001C4DD321|nr:sn-glycerol-3-phosphate ABC transporter ATP-binding protein UgpC [Marinobacter arenosus]MBW0147360.1 sn-glycerol-3-phosphate ABC transporter ATP-binding protein UgpC [Marinobacter arenosus]